MNAGSIRTHQARQIHESIDPALHYLSRLRARMEKIGFPPDDPFYLIVSQAHASLMHLSTETHYMSCKDGVGRPERE